MRKDRKTSIRDCKNFTLRTREKSIGRILRTAKNLSLWQKFLFFRSLASIVRHMKAFIQKLIVVGSLILTSQAALAQWDKPDHLTASCAATPAEMAQNPALTAWMQNMQDGSGQVSLDALVGTWKFNMVIAKATISFVYTADGFFAQNEDDIREKVSFCLDSAESEWLRVSAHDPTCPENKNFYVQPAGVGKMRLMAFTTQRAPGGKVTFKKTASQPLPEGTPKPPLKCQM